MKTWKFAALAGVLGLSVAAHATFYTSESSFLAAINSTYYLEDFSNLNYGDIAGDPTWAAPGGNGYGWTASAPTGVWSNTSSMSTNVANEALTITFTGAPVSAFGGILNNTDFNGAAQGGTVVLTMSNGDTTTVNDGSFLGWVGTSSVTSATILAQGSPSSTLNWAQLDHSYTGAAASTVPEPASMTALALGGLALLRRRAKKA